VTLDLDPERKLALAYVPLPRRAALEALWRLDVTLGSVLVSGREPLISQIRLAWWREALEKLDREAPPGEPLLEALARHVLPAGVRGAELAALEEGWAVLLSSEPLTPEQLDDYALARGGRLFALSARLLGEDEPRVEGAGRAWALIDLARRSGREAEARAAVAAARESGASFRWPAALRPVGMLAALARRDAERGLKLEIQGSPVRILRMLRHRLTGR
jgi:phytoene synthase